jgi:hypothetical protein
LEDFRGVTAAPDTLTLEERKQFMQMPLEERRRWMEQLAERSAAYYEAETDWKELQGGDIVEH